LSALAFDLFLLRLFIVLELIVVEREVIHVELRLVETVEKFFELLLFFVLQNGHRLFPQFCLFLEQIGALVLGDLRILDAPFFFWYFDFFLLLWVSDLCYFLFDLDFDFCCWFSFAEDSGKLRPCGCNILVIPVENVLDHSRIHHSKLHKQGVKLVLLDLFP